MPLTSRAHFATTLVWDARRRVLERPVDKFQSLTVPIKSTVIAKPSSAYRVMHAMSFESASAVGFVPVESPPI